MNHPLSAPLPVSAFEDNYIWLVPGRTGCHVAIVDPGDADPVLATLDHLGLRAGAILVTHPHHDHIGGIEDLLARYPGLPVYGPRGDRIPGLDHPLDWHPQAGHPQTVWEGLALTAPELSLEVMAVPGHTRDHIAYRIGDWLFCGDTLFSAGCGRLFDGTAAQMHGSLAHLSALPDETLIFCTHEYTAANLRFAAVVEPDNLDRMAYAEEVTRLRTDGLPTLPCTLSRERKINPFLRTGTPGVRRAIQIRVGAEPLDSLAVFTELRRWKDGFSG